METAYIEQTLKQLQEIDKETTRLCSTNVRSAAYAILGTAWGLLVKDIFLGETKQMVQCQPALTYSSGVLLGVIFIAVIYFVIEAYRQYSVAKKARNLFQIVLEGGDPIEAEVEMNLTSDKSFKIFFFQMLLCGVMVLSLAIYMILIIYS